jgi:hypothetical protein
LLPGPGEAGDLGVAQLGERGGEAFDVEEHTRT